PLHRLRTRMDALLLRKPPLEPPVYDSVDAALREVEHLQRTLGTLLQIALAESGAALAGPVAVDVAELPSQPRGPFEPAARAQGLSFVCRPAGPAVVQGNRQLLAQLLTNLIENALKYVPRGGRVEVDVRAVEGAVQLTVSDDGPGIAAQDRARAVQPFVRVGA